MDCPSEACIWEEAFRAIQEEKEQRDYNDSDDSEVDVDNFFLRCSESGCPRNRGKPRLVELTNGDFHVCYGASCQHAAFDRDKCLVCTLCGLVVGTEKVRDADTAWLGRSGSSNPDDLSGGPQQGVWKKRRDMFSASVSAWQSAKNIDTRDVLYHETDREARAREDRALVKRGARCVDETPSPTIRKRIRTSKKDMDANHAIEKLTSEAMLTIQKLLQKERHAGGNGKRRVQEGQGLQAEVESEVASCQSQEDPRLLNPRFVLALVLRKYVTACIEDNDLPTMDGIHNCSIYANAFCRMKREEKQKPSLGTDKVCFTGKVQSLSCTLTVALWKACCLCPYMIGEKKGSDSFRPFVSGVLYAMKRGFSIRGGLEVVPCLPELANLLPTLRTQNLTATARQLQAASHRGLCSLHRSVASMLEMPEEESREISLAFQNAARAAQLLSSHVKREL